MNPAFYYVRPDESVMFAPVSGSVDTNYSAAWLTDGAPGKPAKKTGNPSWTIAPAAPVSVSMLAAINHNVDAARSISISGDVTATLTPGTLPADGIPLNPWVSVSPVNVSSMVVAVTSNSPGNVTMGEFYAGTKRTLERHMQAEPAFTISPPYQWQGENGFQVPYDTGIVSRTLSGTAILSLTGLADVEDWYASTRRGQRPTLIVPFPDNNDAWLVTFTYTVKFIGGGNLVRVTFTFTEIPRVRWA